MKSKLLVIFVWAALLYLSYHQVLHFFFWHDDYTHLYKAQNGIVSTFPYQFFSLSVPILYKIFGLNPFYYHLLGIVFYFICIPLVYKLLNLIFENRLYAFLGTCIFASGYLGQGSIIMFVGDGVGSVSLLPLVISLFIFYVSYLKQKKKIYFILTYILASLVFYLGPQRYGGLILPLVLLDWFFWFSNEAGRGKLKHIVLRNVLFLLIFFFEYWGKGVSLNLSVSFSIENAIVQLGNFWNFVFSSFVQDRLIFKALPVYVLFVWIYLLSGIAKKKLLVTLTVFVVLVFSNLFIFRFTRDASQINGFLFVVLIIAALVTKIRGRFLIIACIFASGLSIYFLAAQNEVLDTSYRYFVSYSFVVPLFISLLINKNTKDNYTDCTVIVPALIIVVLNLISASQTQQRFYEDYSRHFAKIYLALKKALPNLDGKTLIYMEGATKEMDFVTGDASRVGELPTEAAFAVLYNSPMPDIVWPETRDDILTLVRDNKLNTDHVFTFIYDGNDLIDTSSATRDEIKNPNLFKREIIVDRKVSLPFDVHGDDLNDRIYTQLPLHTSVFIKNLTKNKIVASIDWSYDSYGPLEAVKSFNFQLDGFEQRAVKFDIGAGGGYVAKLQIVSSRRESLNDSMWIGRFTFQP